MDSHQSANDGVVTDRNMACQRGRIGHDQVVSKMAVMRDMDIGHEKIMFPDGGDATALHSASVHRDVFTQDGVVANDNARRLSLILQMLRRSPDGGIGIDLAALSDLGPTFNVDV